METERTFFTTIISTQRGHQEILNVFCNHAALSCKKFDISQLYFRIREKNKSKQGFLIGMALFEDESECRLLFQLDYTSPLTPEFDPSDRPISDIFGKHLLLLGLCVQIWHSDSRRQAAAHSSWVSAPSGPRSTWSPHLRYTFICCIVNMISSNYSLGQIEWMIV